MKRMISVGAIIALWVIAFGALWGEAAPIPAGADKLPPPTEKQLAASAKNLREIGIAFQAHQENNKTFPNNVYTAKEEPLLSWRVQLLPFIEESDLYQQFRLDEPWDSEHNKKLIPMMPRVYAPVRVKAKPGETFYRGFVGTAAVFGPGKGAFNRGLAVKEITDGLANTGFVFEAAEPVIWTKPDDLSFDEKKPLPSFGGLFDGEFHVLMGDGSTYRLRKDVTPNDLRKLITYAGGEQIDLDGLKAK